MTAIFKVFFLKVKIDTRFCTFPEDLDEIIKSMFQHMPKSVINFKFHQIRGQSSFGTMVYLEFIYCITGNLFPVM
jgi:hypothetical protein